MSLSRHTRLALQDLGDAWRTYAPGSLLSRSALRTAASGALGVLFALWLDIPDAFLAGFTPAMIGRTSFGENLAGGLLRVAGVSAGTVAGALFGSACAQQHEAFTAGLFLLGAFCTYKSLAGPKWLAPFWLRVGMYGAVLAVLTSGEPMETPYAAFTYIALVVCGTTAHMLVHLVLWPEFASERVERHSRGFFAAAAGLAALLAERYARGADPARDERAAELEAAMLAARQAYFAEISACLLERPFIKGLLIPSPQRIDGVAQRLARLREFAEASPPPDPDAYRLQHADGIGRAAGILGGLAAEADMGIHDIAAAGEALDAAAAAMERRHEEMREAGALRPYDTFQTTQLLEFLICMRALAAEMRGLTLWTVEPPAPRGVSGLPFATRAPEPVVDPWPLLPVVVKADPWWCALRAGLSLVLVFWAWLLLDIPGNSMTRALTVLVVTQPILSDTAHKSFLRVTGCLAGALAGLAVMPLTSGTIWDTALWLLAFGYVFAYISLCKPGIAYFGMQAQLALLVALVPRNHLTNDVADLVQRILAILMGVLAVMAVDLLIRERRGPRTRLKEGLLAYGRGLRVAGAWFAAHFEAVSAPAAPAAPWPAAEKASLPEHGETAALAARLSAEGGIDGQAAAAIGAWLREAAASLDILDSLAATSPEALGVALRFEPRLGRLVRQALESAEPRPGWDGNAAREAASALGATLPSALSRLRDEPAYLACDIRIRGQTMQALSLLRRLAGRLDALSRSTPALLSWLSDGGKLEGAA